MSEKFKKLDQISKEYDSTVDFDNNLINYNFRVMEKYLNGSAIMEMGCASGVMTRLLLEKAPVIDVVDGSIEYIEMLKPEFGDRVNFELALFEDYHTDKKYSDIIMARALEHIEKPVELLKKIAGWLKIDQAASIHIVVPNANSFHRQIGVAMGMLEGVTSLSERDYKYGHQRVYTEELLREHVQEAGLKIEHLQGIFFKPLSNAQMEKWTPELLEAFFKVGESYSSNCAELYLKCGLS